MSVSTPQSFELQHVIHDYVNAKDSTFATYFGNTIPLALHHWLTCLIDARARAHTHTHTHFDALDLPP